MGKGFWLNSLSISGALFSWDDFLRSMPSTSPCFVRRLQVVLLLLLSWAYVPPSRVSEGTGRPRRRWGTCPGAAHGPSTADPWTCGRL